MCSIFDIASAAGISDNSTELEKLRADISAKLKDRTRRQMFMKMLVENGKAKVAKAQMISETLGNITGTILSIKPAVDVVLQIPQVAPAALPWAGICVGLEVSNNPPLPLYILADISSDPDKTSKNNTV